ncbi:hypothetical protein CRE_08972 [Caenorhabditis remanei]|uniref:Uncharacterized protein n=1 Tax=Caenorhabditis remanei TaxID=31234 RepID=E3LIJ9_CAERE|nr:hypothetical protein CRE_08972 [Caenorhabditis remanei]
MTAQYYIFYLFIGVKIFVIFYHWFQYLNDSENVEEEKKINKKKRRIVIFGWTVGQCEYYMSMLNMPNVFPLALVFSIDMFNQCNNPEELPNDRILLVHFFIFLAYQFAQLALSLVFLYNPFIMELKKENAQGLFSFFYYTCIYQMISVPPFLILIAFKAVVNYKLSLTDDKRKFLKTTLYHQCSLKWLGISYTSWVHIIFSMQVVSCLAVPATWFFDRFNMGEAISISDLWRVDRSEQDLSYFPAMILSSTHQVRNVNKKETNRFFQIIHTVLFRIFAFSSIEFSLFVYLEVNAEGSLSKTGLINYFFSCFSLGYLVSFGSTHFSIFTVTG